MRTRTVLPDFLPLAAALLTLTGITGCAPRDRGPERVELEISSVYVAEPVLGERTAMYFSLQNLSEADDELVAVSTAVAARAEIHRTLREGDAMRMEPVASLTVPAGGRLNLAPGGYHIMLLDLQGPLRAGDRFHATLQFRHAGELEVRAVVLAYADLEAALAEVQQHDPEGIR